MVSTPASPSSYPISARTPKTPGQFAVVTSTSTPHALSQEVGQSFQTSFQTQATSEEPPPPAFPSASTFTFLPELYNLISHLQLLEGTPEFRGSKPSEAGSLSSRAPTASPLLHRTDPSLSSGTGFETHDETNKVKQEEQEERGTSDETKTGIKHSEADHISKTSSKSQRTLEIKDLPENIYKIKQRIQAARETVTSLPDIHRSVEEQQSEITALNARIDGLKKRLGELAVLAAGEKTRSPRNRDDGVEALERQDVVMQGVEGTMG